MTEQKRPHIRDDEIVERPLPHNLEAERSILGAVLLDNSALAFAKQILTPGDFFLREHRLIFGSMLDLAEKLLPIDSVMLLEDLTRSGQLEAVGGIAYLSQLADGLPRVTNVEHYARIVREKAIRRQVIHLGHELYEGGFTDTGDAGKAVEGANQKLSEMLLSLKREVEKKSILAFKTGADVLSDDDRHVIWTAKGIAAVGGISCLVAKVKAGKTTLVLDMAAANVYGRPFLGLPTLKTPVVYLTEQPVVSFRQAMERAGLCGCKDFVFLPFVETRGLSWPQIGAAAVKECKAVGASVLIVDTLSQFAGLTGDRENNAGDALEAMLPLQQAAAEGISVLATQHERKSGGELGDSGRGSSAYAGAVDIVLSLRRPEGNASKNRRMLQSLSRFHESPADLLIELTDAGYIALGERHETAFREAKDAIFAVAPTGDGDAADILTLAEGANIARPTAQRAIDSLVGDGLLSRIGKGKKGSPFQYFIPDIPFCSTPNIGVEKELKNPAGVSS